MKDIIYHNVLFSENSFNKHTYYIIYEKNKNIVTVVSMDMYYGIYVLYSGLEYIEENTRGYILLSSLYEKYYRRICMGYIGLKHNLNSRNVRDLYNNVIAVYKREEKIQKILSW